MKYLFVLIVITGPFATHASADQLEYNLEVNGMMCAYCAYNVSKELESLDGVESKSVDVDLEQGKVVLQSAIELGKSQIADLLLQAGFELGAVTKTLVSIPQPRRQSDEAVLLSVTMNADQLSDGDFDAVLEALGSIAMQLSGRISVVAPGELETAILRPVLAGRKTVIKVEYDQASRPDKGVVVALSATPAKIH